MQSIAPPHDRRHGGGVERLRPLIAHHRSGFALLLFCTLLIRAVMPTGWMPVTTTHGIAISVCTGMGPAKMTMAHHGAPHEKAPAPEHNKDHPCAFAGAVAPLAGWSVPTLPPPLAIAAAASATPRRAVAIGRGLAAPPPPQTGPPTLI